MLKNIHIKLTKANHRSGPFDIYDQMGRVVAENVPVKLLMGGVGYLLDESVTMIKLVNKGDCPGEKVKEIKAMSSYEFYHNRIAEVVNTATLWSHLTDVTLYNNFYGKIHPYVIEYPFSYDYHDQIVQSIKDYSKVYKYLPSSGVALTPDKVEVDDEWFNKAVVYNEQSSSGMLELVPKPKRNLKEYSSYPKYNEGSKTITFTKSDNWYQYNVFWDVVKNKEQQLFVPTCKSMSIDKEVNQTNMDYGMRSFNKAPIRGKEVKIRHILDNKSDVHIVSRIIISSSQVSYK